MKKITSLIMIMMSCVVLSACQTTSDEAIKVSDQFFAMDTYITYTIYTTASQTESAKALMSEANSEFERIADLANRFESFEGLVNVSTINEQAGITPVVVDPMLIEMVLLAKEVAAQSNGAFSVVLGPVSEIWQQYQDSDLVGIPNQAELDELRPLLDLDNLIVDTQASTLYLTEPGMVLDLGAIAKGYATEYVAKWLADTGIEHAIINAGGNVKTIGGHPTNGAFRIGLQDPNDLGGIFGSVAIQSTSVVTSGDYQRYFEYDGVRYHHLIDPATLQPARLYRSVTIVTPNSTLADALSTALFVLPLEAGQALIETYYPGTAVIWYSADGTVTTNVAMDEIFTLGGE